MSLLVCDSSYDLLVSNVAYHSSLVDIIVCVANNPSKLLEVMLHSLESIFPKFKYVGKKNDVMTMELQVQICNWMTEYLKEQGCSWVIPCDDDEFHIGRLRDCLTVAERDGFNTVYQDGFCFYSTIFDKREINPVRKMIYRDPETVDYNFRKAIHKTKNFKSVTEGNHAVLFNNEKIAAVRYPCLQIRHYNYRKKFLFSHVKDVFIPLNQEMILSKKLVLDMSTINLFDEIGVP